MTESPGALFERLLDVMARLRGPAGCPWDRAQTRASLKPYLIEEAYEVLEAIETGNRAGIPEGLPTLRDRRRPAVAALAVARSARANQGGARALRLAGRQVGVGQGGRRDPRGRRGARDWRGRARAGGAGRCAVLPRERGAALLDRRRGGPAGRDREVPAPLRRGGGGPRRTGQVGRRPPARRAGAVVGERQGA